jgi:serine/threonine-protein kinase RsbW
VDGLATAAGLSVLHELMARVRGDHPEVAELDLAMLETAVIEIAGNVVEHGTPPGGLRFQLALEVTDDALAATLVDTGDPLPSVSTDPQDVLAESGRGLQMVHAVLTELRYERRAGTNVWSMARARTPAREDEVQAG